MTRTQADSIIRASVELAAQLAEAVDQGGDQGGGPAQDPAPSAGPILSRAFAELGAFTLDADRELGQLPDTARLIEAVAAECLCSAFSLWAHRMVIEYLRASGQHGQVLQELVSGARPGSIAMATAMQELAGLGEIPLQAEVTDTGYRVSGRLNWASNIAPGTIVLFPAQVVRPALARNEPAGGSLAAPGERVILWAIIDEPGVAVHPVSGLLALDATHSASLAFTDLRVPRERVVAVSLTAAIARRSTHLSLQTAFCLGLAGRSLTEAEARLAQAPAVIRRTHHALRQEHRDLAAQLHAAAEDLRRPAPVAVTRLRLAAAQLAVEATRHESMLAGGRGYLTAAPSNRRLREATFLPVQSPSEVQLLAELEGAAA